MEKHHTAARDRRSSPPPREFDSLQVSEDAVKTVIKSLTVARLYSLCTRGPRDVHPQHILDMTRTGPVLLISLTNGVNMLQRKCGSYVWKMSL